MKFIDTVKLHELLSEALGNDLVYSLAYDEGKYYLAVSVHKSDRVEYSHGGNIQSCLIENNELGDDIEQLVLKIIPLYENILVEKKND